MLNTEYIKVINDLMNQEKLLHVRVTYQTKN